ncbi:MAG: hypothetical protein LC131_12100 [Anaerolineae bacterium]|nr:hypothetical protein [Anaerolineae bacterium]
MPEQDEAEIIPPSDELPQEESFAEVEESASPGEPAESDQPAETAEPGKSAPPPPRLSRADRDAYERQRNRFSACGRCGYFIADCRLYLGEAALQSAILAARDGWLRLEGDATFHRLATNAYGIDLDMDFDSFDGLCPECHRRFVLVNRESGVTSLKIRL